MNIQKLKFLHIKIYKKKKQKIFFNKLTFLKLNSYTDTPYVFKWPDGSPVDSYWSYGEPNNWNGNEYCLQMGQSGELYDAPCLTTIPCMCEVPQNDEDYN